MSEKPSHARVKFFGKFVRFFKIYVFPLLAFYFAILILRMSKGNENAPRKVKRERGKGKGEKEREGERVLERGRVNIESQGKTEKKRRQTIVG